MQNVPPGVLKHIREAIRRPEGTVSFEYFSDDLVDSTVRGGIIFEIPAGGHVFRLERTSDLRLQFYHASPATGTRVATIDLQQVSECTQAFISFSWSPVEIKLYFGPRVPGAELHSAKGVPAARQFRVGKDGTIYQIGDEGVQVISVNVYRGGKPVLTPTAIEAWRNTKKAVEVLGTGESDEGYLYEVVVTNLTLSVLVTGFEAYAKKRFLELEEEGVAPAIDPVIDAFFPQHERAAGIADLLRTEAAEQHSSILAHIVDRGGINFQNYDACKRAYKKAYDVSFGAIGVDSDTLGSLKQFIQYRHRIIHVSAMMGILNQPDVPPEEPVFPKKALAEKAVACFDRVITQLHEATLQKLRQH